MTMLSLTVPRNLEDLAHQWKGFILRELQKAGRVKFNAEDVLSHVMMKLIEKDIVAKFHEGSREQSHPLVVDAAQAAEMCGITLWDFLEHQIRSDDWIEPVDAKGHLVPGGLGYTSQKALYLFADVVALAASVPFPGQVCQVFPEATPPTVEQWKAYLAAAVRNHSANLTRTHKRRFSREFPVDACPGFGSLRDDAQDREALSLESFIGPDKDETVTVIEQSAEVALLLRDAPGLTKRKSSDNKNFIELLQEGYTIREASAAVRLTVRDQRLLTAHVSGRDIEEEGIG